MKNRILYRELPDYHVLELKSAIYEFLENSGVLEEISGARVLLKPNLLGIFDIDKAVTTHPAVIEGVVSILKEHGCAIGIGDSPGGIVTKINLNKLYERLGVQAIAEKYDVTLEDFESPRKYSGNVHTKIKYYELSDVLDRYDYVINLPKLKTHMFQILTCGVKNLFGFVPGREKAKFHLKLSEPHDFADMLIDIALITKPIFTIVDGIMGMEGEGPSNGAPKKMSLLLGARDVFLLDAVVSVVTGLGMTVPVVAQGLKRQLIKEEEIYEESKYIGEHRIKPPLKKTIDQRAPLWLRRVVRELTTNKPVVEKKRCIGCRVCYTNCPPLAISMVNNKAKINYRKCIRCFCCHELCPEGAIKVRHGFIAL